MPNIIITKAAQQALAVKVSKFAVPAFLLKLKKYGCSGYAFELMPLKDTNEQHIKAATNLFVLKEQLHLLEGLSVDYTKSLLEEKFTYKHPNMNSTCGCGESFLVDKPQSD